MSTEHQAVENSENTEKTPTPVAKIKELDGLDRFLLKTFKRSCVALFMCVPIGLFFSSFITDLAIIGAVLLIIVIAASALIFNMRNNPETCEHYGILVTNGVDASSPKFSDPSFTRRMYDPLSDNTNPASPSYWGRYANKY